MRNKRGLSPLSLIVIIAISIFMLIVIFVLLKNVSEGSFFLGKADLTIENVYVKQNSINVDVKRNSGAEKLTKLKFIFDDGANTEETEESIVPEELILLREKSFSFILNELTPSNVKKVSIVPIYGSGFGEENIGKIIDTYEIGVDDKPEKSTPPPTITTICGNNIKEGSEKCDGTDLNGKNCVSQSFTGGTLSCSSSCQFDTSQCTGAGPVCGDDSCNGDETCSSCLADCGICPVCGNDIKEGTEVCDGTDLNGETCSSQGLDSGTLSCESDCSGFDTSGCLIEPVCGNSIVEGSEKCDSGTNCIAAGQPSECTCQTDYIPTSPISVNCIGTSDLTVNVVSVTRGSEDKKNEITVVYDISNILGIADASNIIVRVNTDSTDADPEGGPFSLTIGASQTGLSIIWTYSSSGTYNPTITIDPDNTIIELDETNNQAGLGTISCNTKLKCTVTFP